MFKKYLFLLLALLFSPQLWAATYVYTGSPFVNVVDHTSCAPGLTCTDFTPSMRLTGSFTTATALAPNLSGADISANLTSYSFSDGVNTYASSDTDHAVIYMFTVSTDPYGDINGAMILIELWQTGTPLNHVSNDRVGYFFLGDPSISMGDSTWSNGICDGATPTLCNSVSADSSTTRADNITPGQWASSRLSGLTLSSGSLTPAFDPATTAYTATVSYCDSSITLTPTLVDTLGSVTVNGVAATSGAPSDPVALSVGSNSIPVEVTGSDSTTRTYTVDVTRSAQAADHFAVSAPATATTGQAVNVTVTAQDACGSNATVAGYAGTVHFTSSDGAATLPADTTLTGGTGTYSVTFGTVGNQTVTATDTVTTAITGRTGMVAVAAPPATHFAVSAPASAVRGTPVTFTVTALDGSNSTVTGYSGTVHFTSSDAAATLPADATLTGGTGSFSATFGTVGNQTVTATDTVTASLTGSSGTVAVAAPPATHFAVSAPASAITGTPVTFTVTALDGSNGTVTGYSGTVHFTSSDAAASLPANATLTGGTGSFSATFGTVGSQTVTATDTVTTSITGSSGAVAVTAPVATHFAVTAPASAIAGTPVTVTVTALDGSNGTVTGYTGTVHFSSSDAAATLPANATLTGGSGSFPVTFATVGNQTVTATDTVTASLTGTGGAVNVTAAAIPVLAPWALWTLGAGLIGLAGGALRRRA